jgi:hypothetical protein
MFFGYFLGNNMVSNPFSLRSWRRLALDDYLIDLVEQRSVVNQLSAAPHRDQTLS